MSEREKDGLSAPSEVLRLLVENVHDYAVFVTTPDGYVESWNPGAERLLGYEQEEILGQWVGIFFTPEDVARGVPEQEMRQAREAGRGNDDRWHVRKDGSRFWAGGMLTPLWDDEGELRGFAKIMRDRTEWKLAQDRMAFQAQLLDAVGQAVIATAPDGTILFWNRFAEKLYGWASSEVVGRNVLQILVPDSEAVGGAEIMSCLQAGREWSGEFVLRRKDGTTFPVHVTDTPVFDDQGALHAIIGVSSDISGRRETEEALRESEARFRGLIEQAPFSVQVFAIDGRTLQVNRAWEDLWGLSFEQMASYNLLHDRQLEAKGILPQLRRAFAGEVVHIRDVALDPNEHVADRSRNANALRSISVVAYPLKDDMDRVRNVVLVHEDVTPRVRTEDALRASEERFRQLADAMPQIVWTATPEGEIDYLNRRWQEFTGSQEDFGNAAWGSILHPDEAKLAGERWSASVRSGEPFQMDLRLLERSRQAYRWHLIRTVAVRDDAGRVVRWFGTATDIHEQKRAEESARYLAEASAALSGVVDYESTLQRVANLAVPYFSDWSAVDVANPDGTLRRLAVSHQDPEKVRLAHELMQDYPPDPQSPTGAFAVLRSGKAEIVSEIPDDLLVRGTKDERHLRLIRSLGLRSYICVPLIVSGSALGVLTFATAESGRTYTDADLALAIDLAGRAAVAIENTQLYQALREADRRKDEFLATLAHELRNPLAPIHSAVQLMRLSDITDPEMLETIDIVERQVTHIIRLVDDLMEVSRISRGKIEIRCERLDLTEVVRNAVETSRPLLDARGHSVVLTPPLHPVAVTGDGIRLAQVVTNLLNNAAKFTPERGQVSVAIDERDGQATVRVRDNGSGIAPELLPRVFELFAQGSEARDSYGGLGIGLALVKQIVEMHGGRIEAHSGGEGRGSEFVVRLPSLIGDGNEHRSEDTHEPRQVGTRRVLVADDNVPAAKLLARMLRTLGHEVLVAHDGQKAVELGEKFEPDMILMDLGMPKLNGLEAARMVRQRPWGREVLLVALTGWGQEEDRRRTKAAGFDGHEVKPLALGTLRAWLATAPSARQRDPS